MGLELESFIAENETVTILQEDPSEREEFEATLAGLSDKQKKAEKHRFQHKLICRKTRVKKQDYENSLKLQEEFLEKKIMEITPSIIARLNQQY